MSDLKGKDRLIVALDMNSHEQALDLVDHLDNVSFFKIGWGLLLGGDILKLLRQLQEKRTRLGGVFVDLKLSGDIGATVASFVRACLPLNVKFLTLVESVPLAITLETVRVAVRERGDATFPQLLMVPCLSSLDMSDLRASGEPGEFEDINSYIVRRARIMLDAGCNGLIVSGDAIRVCRETFGTDVTLVSPGIRPAGTSTDDHKRLTTPTDAIRMGSDYLVVGRPICNAPNPRAAAARIIEEIDEALAQYPNAEHNPDPIHAAG